MAQVYSFVDENGLTRLFAEIVPDPAGTPFNGGTISGNLTMQKATNSIAQLTLDSQNDWGSDIRLNASPSSRYIELNADAHNYPQLKIDVDGSGNDFVQLLDGGHSRYRVASSGLLELKPSYSDVSLAAYTADPADGDTGVLCFTILPTGQFSTYVNAAPANGALTAGQLAFWFDDTNGAAKLMLKGKSANGTVVTGSLALT